MWPAYAPSTAMWTIVPTLRHSCHLTPSSSMSRPLPAATVCPSTVATTPRPLRSSMSVTRERSSSPPQAFCRLLLIGCEDAHSASSLRTRRLPELGFTFPIADLQVQRLRNILSDPAYGLAEPLREAASRLEFDSLKGFLKGFIDLTFEHDGRWYILDYKSNWLGPDASYYGGERLVQALAGEHYYLQYLIYLVALRRFLRQRLSDFTNEQLGGAYYLFLRGMPDAGVYFARPSDALLDALDQLFEGQQ